MREVRGAAETKFALPALLALESGRKCILQSDWKRSEIGALGCLTRSG